MTPVVARLCAGQRRISLKAKSFTLAPLRYLSCSPAYCLAQRPVHAAKPLAAITDNPRTNLHLCEQTKRKER